ncbi:pyridoxamine 5'-phosphate oxidase family protein [Actinosynnema mirum]|uniref:Pyridoxamine 5'-phosphate oxidase-related FMN-binding n=1 Tax=Actinosynnema mirum (strain ATCC 29888 / DSM 43827 / JCM 3225 / NBRC 14064 / NCIMB 13271 / NRRL B-12336 / IMRU 3971 / 101) TaxID=446462 RepID=C6WN18_ACTMD|nr:pyridoxamine 5'-phosphate oxidase family protein [Actinosynnema mirum]ACU38531.1 pyridoxamine 5'-phosphate oxidase-related FMN- binding [Actinosynnema mirum DSM 43827]
MRKVVRSFADLQDPFLAYIQDIVYATMTTVDKRNRPRARVLLPIWEVRDGVPIGWIAAYRTPVKVAHLARNPHTTISYWNPKQNAVFADCRAEWVQEDQEVRREIWELYRKGSPPGVGYDPANFWRHGPEDPKFGLIKLEPWRIQVLRGFDLSSVFWEAPDADDEQVDAPVPAAPAVEHDV